MEKLTKVYNNFPEELRYLIDQEIEKIKIPEVNVKFNSETMKFEVIQTDKKETSESQDIEQAISNDESNKYVLTYVENKDSKKSLEHKFNDNPEEKDFDSEFPYPVFASLGIKSDGIHHEKHKNYTDLLQHKFNDNPEEKDFDSEFPYPVFASLGIKSEGIHHEKHKNYTDLLQHKFSEHDDNAFKAKTYRESLESKINIVDPIRLCNGGYITPN
jgi:hypothetical protein